MPYVSINGNENFELSLRKFKRMVEREGIVKAWKKNEFFEKPSVMKRRKRKSAIRKSEKKVRRNTKF